MCSPGGLSSQPPLGPLRLNSWLVSSLSLWGGRRPAAAARRPRGRLAARPVSAVPAHRRAVRRVHRCRVARGTPVCSDRPDFFVFIHIDKLQIYMLGSPLLAPPSRALDLTGGLQAGHLSPENLDLSALGLHGTRAGVGGAGGTEGVRAAVEGIRECAARRPAV